MNLFHRDDMKKRGGEQKRLYIDLDRLENKFEIGESETELGIQVQSSEAMSYVRELLKEKEARTEGMKTLCTMLVKQFEKKNADYGGSFFNTFERYGIVSVLSRLSDKLQRIENIYIFNGGMLHVNDERVEDTLMDLASYALMTILALKEKGEAECE